MFKQCILFFEFLAVNSIMKVFGAIFILGKLHWKLNVFFYQRNFSQYFTLKLNSYRT